MREGPGHLVADQSHGRQRGALGIGGGERAWPKGQKLPRPRAMAIIIGEPIYPPVRAAGERVKRSDVRSMTAELHQRLQDLFDRAQRQVGL